jgi:hypothetical protein
MQRARQFGQSMTEYLVVLGVTGAALLATTTDVGKLFDSVHNNYQAQSSEMNKVQLYNSHKVRFSENESTENFDDGDTPPAAPDAPQDAPALPSVEFVYDKYGKPIGQMDGDTLLDEAGNIIAWCQRSPTGDCVFVDEKGNIILGGATSGRTWVDDEGNELPLQALTSGGKVLGFAYLYKNRYYSAADRKPLDPQPTGLTAKPMRTVKDIKDGKPQVAGYELSGNFYSIAQTLVLKPSFDKALDSEKKELVTVQYSAAPSSKWDGYSPCLVMPSGWSDLITDGSQLSGAWEKKFNDPSIRIGSLGAIGEGTGGYIDSPASACGGATTVTLDPASGKWIFSK